jgi:hypothetical protein
LILGKATGRLIFIVCELVARASVKLKNRYESSVIDMPD